MLLLRAIGDLQCDYDDTPLDDLEAIAAEMGVDAIEIPALIAAGIGAGYIEDDRDGAVMLSANGQRWYARDLARR